MGRHADGATTVREAGPVTPFARSAPLLVREETIVRLRLPLSLRALTPPHPPPTSPRYSPRFYDLQTSGELIHAQATLDDALAGVRSSTRDGAPLASVAPDVAAVAFASAVNAARVARLGPPSALDAISPPDAGHAREFRADFAEYRAKMDAALEDARDVDAYARAAMDDEDSTPRGLNDEGGASSSSSSSSHSSSSSFLRLASLRVACLGARAIATAAAGDDPERVSASEALSAALAEFVSASRDDSDSAAREDDSVHRFRSFVDALASACADEPHAFAVAAALSSHARWTHLTASPRGDLAALDLAAGTFRAAAAAAERAAKSAARRAAHSASAAEDVLADARLGEAQVTLRAARVRAELAPSWRGEEGEEEGGEEDPEGTRKKKTPDSDEDASSEEALVAAYRAEVKGRLEAAEATAAAAIAAAEALGDADAPRVGLAVACAAEQRFEAVAVAAKANAASDEAARRRRRKSRNQTKSQTNDQNQNGMGRVSFVDGGGVMLAEGLYRNALRDLGTIRPPTATPSDPDAVSGGAARWDLRLCAAHAHARYARVLSAAGANRADEARRWAEAAAREWRGPPGAEKLLRGGDARGEGVDMSHDAGTMIPLAPPET